MLKIMLTAGFWLSFLVLLAQGSPSDSTQYIFGLPVTEEVDSVPAGDHGPPDLIIKIPADKLPKKLLRTLTHDDLYRGWEKFPIYLQKNTKHYIVRVMEGNSMKVFGLNEDGNVVTFDEVAKPDSLRN